MSTVLQARPVTCEDLGEFEREMNRVIAGILMEMIEKRGQNPDFDFIPGTAAIPTERIVDGSFKNSIPIEFTRATYMGFRTKYEQHIFFVCADNKTFFVPVFIKGVKDGKLVIY